MERANPSDAELLDASRRGERAAFRELVERCAPMVGAVSYAATRDRTLSEDISQDTFVAAWRDLDRLRDASALRPWLCGIARNLASKARRRRGRELVVADPDAFAAASTPFDALRDGQAEQVVAAALARVPDLYREALVLFYYEGRSTKDVAVALGVGEDVVYKRLSRGRRYLAAGVEQLVETELKRRRSRRDLGARVLAALPVPRWMAPSHADAASKGSSMWKLGVAGMAAVTITVAALSSLPRLDAAPVERANHLDATARVERVAPVTVTRAVHAAAVPQLPSIPAGQGTPASAAATPVRVRLDRTLVVGFAWIQSMHGAARRSTASPTTFAARFQTTRVFAARIGSCFASSHSFADCPIRYSNVLARSSSSFVVAYPSTKPAGRTALSAGSRYAKPLGLSAAHSRSARA